MQIVSRILEALWNTIKFIFSHRPVLYAIIALVIVLLAYNSYQNRTPHSDNPLVNRDIPSYQKTEPSKKDAPYVVQTFGPDLVYYYNGITDTGAQYVLTGVWYYDHKKYELFNGELPLKKSAFMGFKFYDR
jgi:hypothetical protein